MPSRRLPQAARAPASKPALQKTLVSNRRARHDFEIIETTEAGIELRGSEVKSLRQGKGSLQDAFAVVRRGEVFLKNAHIPRYEHSSHDAPDEKRDRKLLLHKKEIQVLEGKASQSGLTLVPLRLYLDHELVKVELALARGKRKYEKRAKLKEKDHRLEMERAAKAHRVAGKAPRIRS